jgi:hypothetical protein
MMSRTTLQQQLEKEIAAKRALPRKQNAEPRYDKFPEEFKKALAATPQSSGEPLTPDGK